MISHRPYNPYSDANCVLNLKLRPSDIVEMVGKGYHSMPAAIATSLGFSCETEVIEVTGVGIVGVFGINPISEGVAIPWMLCSGHLKDNSASFLRQSKKMVDRWANAFPLLTQEVWEGSETALRWLEWLGFEDAQDNITYDGSIIYKTMERRS